MGICPKQFAFIPSGPTNTATVSDTLGFKPNRQASKWEVYQIHLLFYPIFRPQNGRCIRYTWFQIPSSGPKVAGVSDTPGLKSHFQAPKWQVYQIHLVSNSIFRPQSGRCIRYTWFKIPFSGPKVAGVSDTPGLKSHFQAPKWQVYQIHLLFYPILSPQNGRCIRYTWFQIPSSGPKVAGVSDTPGFKSIFRPQSGRCIRYTCFSIPFCHPEMASVSDTIGF